MPMYEYHCDSCDSCFTEIKSFSKYKEPEAEPCPSCKAENSVKLRISSPPMLVSGTQTHIKTPDGFKEKLKSMKKAYRGSTIEIN
ncbi:MAG: hypothetical protein BV459_08230 [Thermoplasmata archaeon M11B2D]|nr:MAG: hypothetical protein BV459_08230 [Thermoplasmata archaeon M11B2D]